MVIEDTFSTANNGPDQVLPAFSHKTSDPDGTVKLYKTSSGPASLPPISLYTMFKNTVEKFPEYPALFVKREGQWRQWTYKEYFTDSILAAKAMIKLGLDRFHGVCIMGYNSPEWVISHFGCIFASGFSAGVYTTNSPEACRIVADNCKAQIILVEDSSSLDKFLAVKRLLPDIKAIIQWSGVPSVPGVLSWAEFMAIGMHESDEDLRQRLLLAAVNHCCTLIYTSGTTGPPKGVMLSQDNLSWAGVQYQAFIDAEMGEAAIVSYLPLSHLAAQLADIYYPVAAAQKVYFSQPDALKGTLVETMKEVQPWGFLGVPRVWEKIYEKLQEAGAESGIVKRKIATWAKFHGSNYYNAIREGRELTSYEQWSYYLAKTLILNRVKEAVGLDKAVMLVSGTAPIAKEVLQYFCSLDLPIMEAYGMTENLSLCSFSNCKPRSFKFGAVGKVLDLTEACLIGNDEFRKGEGEICTRGRNTCMGYLRMPEQTDKAIDDDGWLHTGDLGFFDEEGFLYITGRLKELVITAGGENISPVLIENAVKLELPCISNAMLIGDKRKYLTILLTLKSEVDIESSKPLDNLTTSCISWMRQIGSQATTVFEAIKEVNTDPNGNLAQAIQKGILRYNTMHSMSNAQKIQKWTILPHDFSIPTGELNNTMKLKRQFVLEKYADDIEKMYAESSIKIKSKL